MNYLLKNTIAAIFLSAGVIGAMEKEPTGAENQKLSLRIIKAAVERDGDTMVKILKDTPLEQRKFYIDFPEYNFCGNTEKSLVYSPTCKVYKNYFSFVDVYKSLGMQNNYIGLRIEREPIPTSDEYDYVKIKDSQGKVYEFAIDKPAIQPEWVKPSGSRKIMPTPLMLAAYSKDSNGIKQELLKPKHDRDELIYSLFIAIDQNCSSCVEALLSKKESLKLTGFFGSNRDEDNCCLYRTLLQEAANRENINIFEILIKTNPLNCLNTPVRYPITNYSDLTTVLDDCIWKAQSGRQRAFFQKCVDICEKYGAKTLDDLVKEGYVKPREPEDPYARYKFGFIED